MSVGENKKIAEKFIEEIFNKVNLENVSRFLTPDFTYHGSGEDISGMENFKEWVSSDHSIIPDIHFTIEESISELDKVATVWIVEGTHSKDFRGIPATHKKFETAGVSIFHFEGNKIKEAWTIIDGLTAALQVGAVKTISSEAD
ncbi:MAG: ester cyclase [Candidatus Nitrosopolaris sp.]